MKIVILHTRLAPYYVACLSELVASGHELLIFARPQDENAPFDRRQFEGIGELRDRSIFNENDILDEVQSFHPDAVLVAGWSDQGYMKVCRQLRKRSILVIAGCDTQWKGSFRQYLASWTACWHIHRSIDVLWGAGERQRQFAAKLAYTGDRSWDGVYACNWGPFSAVANNRFQKPAPRGAIKRGGFKLENTLSSSLQSQPSSLSSSGSSSLSPQVSNKSFAFVGRYAPVKGLDTLAEAYRLYSKQVQSPWKLLCAGKGECQGALVAAGAEDRGFIQPEALPDFFAEASAFILPSRFEPWGVVVQEAAATGLPLIVSDVCGAGVHLLRDRWNGRIFAAGDAEHLADCMLWMHQQSDDQLVELGHNSFELSKQYTPERWTRTLLEGVEALKASK